MRSSRSEHMDIETVRRISEVARLHLTEDELKQLASEMDELLGHFKSVQDIKPPKSSHAAGTAGSSHYMHDLKNSMRDDTMVACDPKVTEAIRKEFTKSEGKHLTAPKSIK